MEAIKVTKQQLYDFVDAQIIKQKNAAFKEIDTLIEAAVNPILENWIDFSEIDKLAERLAEMIVAAKEVTHYADAWGIQSVARDLNSSISSLTRRIHNDIRADIRGFVKDPTVRALNTGVPTLDLIAADLQADAADIRQKLSDLDKLRRELKNVIGIESNGQRAYKALVALGVDMKEFETAPSMLPAVVKLSVDPCLLTGGCQ